jgi:hypothetical protein
MEKNNMLNQKQKIAAFALNMILTISASVATTTNIDQDQSTTETIIIKDTSLDEISFDNTNLRGYGSVSNDNKNTISTNSQTNSNSVSVPMSAAPIEMSCLGQLGDLLDAHGYRAFVEQNLYFPKYVEYTMPESDIKNLKAIVNQQLTRLEIAKIFEAYNVITKYVINIMIFASNSPKSILNSKTEQVQTAASETTENSLASQIKFLSEQIKLAINEKMDSEKISMLIIRITLKIGKLFHQMSIASDAQQTVQKLTQNQSEMLNLKSYFQNFDIATVVLENILLSNNSIIASKEITLYLQDANIEKFKGIVNYGNLISNLADKYNKFKNPRITVGTNPNTFVSSTTSSSTSSLDLNNPPIQVTLSDIAFALSEPELQKLAKMTYINTIIKEKDEIEEAVRKYKETHTVDAEIKLIRRYLHPADPPVQNILSDLERKITLPIRMLRVYLNPSLGLVRGELLSLEANDVLMLIYNCINRPITKHESNISATALILAIHSDLYLSEILAQTIKASPQNEATPDIIADLLEASLYYLWSGKQACYRDLSLQLHFANIIKKSSTSNQKAREIHKELLEHKIGDKQILQQVNKNNYSNIVSTLSPYVNQNTSKDQEEKEILALLVERRIEDLLKSLQPRFEEIIGNSATIKQKAEKIHEEIATYQINTTQNPPKERDDQNALLKQLTQILANPQYNHKIKKKSEDLLQTLLEEASERMLVLNPARSLDPNEVAERILFIISLTEEI